MRPRHLVDLIVAVAAAGSLVSCGSGTDTSRPAARPPASQAANPAPSTLAPSTSVPTLTLKIPITAFVGDYFMTSVVRDQFGGGRHVVRWPTSGTVVVSVAGSPTPQDLRVLDDALRSYDRLVPFAIRRGNAGDVAAHGAVTVNFAPKAAWARILEDPDIDLEPAGWTYTFSRGTTELPGTAAELSEAKVVVDSLAPQAARDRVIAHELGHAMGLGHGTCRNSLMYDGPDARPLWSATPLDEEMLALLYDSRLTAGMTEPEVREHLDPTARSGPTCGAVAWQLVEHDDVAYYCQVGEGSRPCVRYGDDEPSVPVADPDAWVLDGLIADYDPSLWVEYRFAGQRLLCENTREQRRPCVVFTGVQPAHPVVDADYFTNGSTVEPASG